MKKGLLKLLFGLGIFVVALGVNAETIDSVEGEGNSTSTDVTVGEVDESIYSATITWKSMSFDYKYNDDTKSFEWKTSPVCTQIALDDDDLFNQLKEEGADFYSLGCSTKLNPTENAGGLHYLKETASEVMIFDNSQNGKIVPSIKWASEPVYENVLAKFRYLGYDGYRTLETEEVPSDGRQEGYGSEFYYVVLMDLKNDPNKTPVKPTPGDKIGTLTVSIRSK